MGAVQVPRHAGALIACGAALVLAAPAHAETAAEPVAVIDLRSASAERDASRTRLHGGLAIAAGVRVLDEAQRAALAGEARDADDTAAATALAEAKEAYGALSCGTARPAAEEAVLLLAGRQAAGLDERARLATAWTYVLLCADRDGDGPMARAAADRLRALGGAPAVTADVWARYPEIDAATDRDIVELTVVVVDDAAVEIDGVAGAAKRFVSAGKHVVAVASGGTRGAVFVTVHGKALTVDVPVTDRRGEWTGVAAQIATWQGEPPTPGELTEMMTRLSVRFAVVLDDGAPPVLWIRGPDDTTARAAETKLARPPDAAAIAQAVVARASVWSDGGPDPDRPLLTEDDVPRRGGKRDDRVQEPTRWWVYAVIGGALAAGAVTIYALETGQDRQRIELTF
jgi:hypothetical protein